MSPYGRGELKVPRSCVSSFPARTLSCFSNIHQILNRLLAQFGGAFRNKPEPMVTGRIATKGKALYHLKSFGIPTVVFVEVRNGSVDDRLSAIAQVIAECKGKASLCPSIID